MRMPLLWLLLILLVPLPALAEQAVRVAFEASYPPFIHADANGRPSGLSADFLDILAKSSGLQLHFGPPSPLPEALAQIRDGRMDLITSLAPTPERSRHLSFTRPYVRIPAIIVVPVSRRSSAGLAQLRGQRIAVGQGYAVETFLRQNYPDLQLQPVASDAMALEHLRAGQVDAVVMDIASAHWLFRQPANATTLHIAGEVGFEYALAFAASHANQTLIRQIDEQLEELPLQVREDILREYLARSPDQHFRAKPLTPLTAVAASLTLIFVIAWTIRKRRNRRIFP